MKINVENLGVLKQAEFELGELTIICGRNNTGKTYAAYALFGFLHVWRRNLKIDIPRSSIEELSNKGSIKIDISLYAGQDNNILHQICQEYTKMLPKIFASKEDYFTDTAFRIDLRPEQLEEFIQQPYERKVASQKGPLFSLSKKEGDKHLVVSLLSDKDKVDLPVEVIQDIISENIGEILLGQQLPNPFIASAERTGAAIFRRELDFARNRLLEEMSKSSKSINPLDLLFKSYQNYALPVEFNVNFTRSLNGIVKTNSFLVKDYKDVLTCFSDIIGGEYVIGGNDTINFKPSGKSLKLSMDESSSAVRSLLDVGFYLRHRAKPGDLLIIDEPELNLHPDNQRRITRLLTRLVNLGMKVFITTHSDYIIKELNTLIMLHQDNPRLKKIAEDKHYCAEELIAPDKIRTYVAENALIQLSNKKRKSSNPTLVKAIISPEHGIAVDSFDQTIDEMNELQEKIIWGE